MYTQGIFAPSMVVKRAYRWFDGFIGGFAFGEGHVAHMASVKERHSRTVARICRELSHELGWRDDQRVAAEILGLVHDVGRFPQVARYSTFADMASVDHGEAGACICSEQGVLHALVPALRSAVMTGVRYHNKHLVPLVINRISRPFVQLIRDADKLDIFRVIVDSYHEGTLAETLDAGLSIPQNGSPHPGAVEDILAHRTVAHSHIASRVDFILMQLSWVYDFTFEPALRRLHASGHLDTIEALLPNDPEVRGLARGVLDDFEARFKKRARA